MKSLICEGTCNPTVRALDEVLKKAARTEVGTYTPPGSKVQTALLVSLLTDETVAKVRSLVYTPHVPHEWPGVHECQVCHAKRRY
jgi:hypothetical protein